MCRSSRFASFLLALLVVLAAVECRASMEPMDDRGDVKVGIVQPTDDGGGELADAAADALRDRLIAEGFEVELVAGPVADPRDFLQQNPDVIHLITDLRPSAAQEIGAILYTQGTTTPRSFDPAPVETLVARVRAFLISRTAVEMRLAIADESLDAYDRALREGLSRMEEPQAARAAFEEAARLRPDAPAPHLNLALVHKRLGNDNLRRQHVADGLALDPENHALRNEKALLRIMDGDLQGAAAILEDLPQDDPVVLWNLAYVYGQMQRMDKAREYFEKVAELEANQRLSVVAESRLDELQRKEERLALFGKGLWVAMAGLGGVVVIALIVLIGHRLSRRASEAEELAPGDRLAVQVQVGLAVVSGLFSIATVILSNLLSGP